MINFNQTVGYDKDAILVLRINLDGEYMYFSDTFDKITLDGIDFDGKVILKDSLSEIENGCDISLGGGMGYVGNLSFGIARYSDYNNGVTTFDEFMNDFYPVSGKPLLTSQSINLGLLWAGATSLSQITWLELQIIEDVYWDDNAIMLGCVSYDELSAKSLPVHALQKDYNNEISFAATPPTDSLGQSIPLVYGDLSDVDLEYCNYSLAPCIKINRKTNTYKVSDDICKTDATSLFKYIQSAKAMLAVTTAGFSVSNTRKGQIIDLAVGSGASLQGSIKFHPQGYISGNDDYENMIDGDHDTYTVMDPDVEFKLTANAQLSEDKIGYNSGAADDANLVVEWAGNESGTSRLFLRAYLPETMGTVSWVDFTTTNARKYTTLNFGILSTGVLSISDLDKLEFTIASTPASPGEVGSKIYNVFIEFPNQTVYAKDAISILQGFTRSFERNLTNERSWRLVKNVKDIDAISDTEKFFANVQGYVYDSWIN